MSTYLVNNVLNVKALVGFFNQEKALVGAFSVIVRPVVDHQSSLQVVRVGSKKTAFANFIEIAKMLHRPPKHLLQFLFAELGTSGAIDGNNQLIIKGELTS